MNRFKEIHQLADNFLGNNEMLLQERQKAIQTLQIRSKNIEKDNSNFALSKSPGMNSTEYATYRWKDTFDISVTDKTIEIKSFNNISDPITFEPSEITGRSTSCNLKAVESNSKVLSVDQILASSCSEEVRNLRQSLYGVEDDTFPKTSDLSLNSIRESLSSSTTPELISGFLKNDESGFVGENFVPVDKFLSKLFADEKEWEREYADIPANMNVKDQSKNSFFQTSADFSRFSSVLQEMSMGSYFQTRSADLRNIITVKSPKKHRPVALINDSDLISERDSVSKSVELPQTNNSNEGDGTQSYSLSLSAIANALNEIDINATGTTIMNHLLAVKSVKNCLDQPPSTDLSLKQINCDKTCSLDPKVAFKICKKTYDKMEDNKENFNPESSKDIELSDTASFTESLLELSSVKKKIEYPQNVSMNKLEKTVNIPKFGITGAKKSEKNHIVISSISNREKSRKRTHSALEEKSPNNKANKNKDNFTDFQKQCDILSPIKQSTLRKTSPRFPVSTNDLIFETKIKNKNSDAKRIINFENQEKCFTAHISGLDQMSSTKQSVSPILLKSQSYSRKSPNNLKSGMLSPNHSPKSKNKFPLSSTENTIIDNNNRKVTTDLCASPEYGKFSLPNYGLHSRVPSTSNLSAKSGSSGWSRQEGQLPLKATYQSLSWGSVKLRKTVQKSIQIKNTCNKRLIIRVEIIGPGFQIVNSDQGSLLTFHSQECRTITLSFCPTVIGMAVGEIRFFPTIECAYTKQCIPLHGYGGHACIIPQGVVRGPVGPPFLTLGEFGQLSRSLTKTFIISNKGSLTGFASITVDSIGLDVPRLCDSIEINPKKVLIHPQSEVEVSVTFKPRRDDIKKIMKKMSSVIILANIRIICGDEPTRHRIRKLINNLTEKEKSKISTGDLDYIWEKFFGESAFNLEDLKEESQAAVELIETLKTHEIALTLNHMQSLDDTIETTFIYTECDETVMFRTIISNKTEQENNTMQAIKAVRDDCVESWAVSPNELEINPVYKKKAFFTVSNNFLKPYDFQIDSNFKDLFNFYPKDGKFYPGEKVDIAVTFVRPGVLPSEEVVVDVYIENSKLSIPIKFISDGF